MSVCAAPTCSHQSFDGSSYYVDVDVDVDVKSYILAKVSSGNRANFVEEWGLL
jgi:hypothetical protein